MFHKSEWIEILSHQLPGEKTQLHMAPAFRGEFSSAKNPVPAAVLVLFYTGDEETRLVFIKRNEYDGPHSAQVSFPGGAREATDLSLEETALRETREEIGVNGPIEILGSLTPLHIPVSNFMVHPFVGWMEEHPVFHPDPSEVQYVIEVSLSELLDPSNRDSETIYHHNRSIEAPFYRVGKEKIWGATAMMLSELLQLATCLQ
ncbi:MAG: CoA pyrophosphatase [Bacteroidota bacterium]|nr:CoA pyrophosphatase [Bacteroidota bacterium]